MSTPAEILYEAMEEWFRDEVPETTKPLLPPDLRDLLVARFSIKMALEEHRSAPASRAFSTVQVANLLRDHAESEGGITAWCEARNIDPTSVKRFLDQPRTSPTRQILDALDLAVIVRYRRITRTEPGANPA